TITASGGTAPYTFAVTAGALPAGLMLASDGTITGTPTAAGTFTFTLTATDADSFTGSQGYSLTVDPPIVPLQPDYSAAFHEYALPTPNSAPSGGAVGPDGSFWFTQQNRGFELGKISPSGVVTEFPGTSGGNPVIDLNGNVWFASKQGSNAINEMTPDGVIL